MKQLILDFFTMLLTLFSGGKQPALIKKLPLGSKGVDLSHHNDEVDLKVLVNNVDFVYLKATEGLTFVSRVYKERVKQLKKLNKVPFGSYHYYRTDVNAIEQAKHFIKTADFSGGLPPVLDIEKMGNYFKPRHVKDCLAFLRFVERETGITPIVYTNYFFAKDILKPTEDFKKFPLWLAWYTKDFNRVKIPAPWENIYMWQFTDKGIVKGVDGQVDLNIVKS